jgi:hypothetical protein
MVCAMRRALVMGLPWLALMALSIAITYGMSMVATNAVSASAQSGGPVPTMVARPNGSTPPSTGNWIVYVGPNCWLPDPSGLEACKSETASGDHP